MCRIVAAVLGTVLVMTGAVQAQDSVSGSLQGMVTDPNGQPLPGIRVTITSPTQIGGSKTAYTDKDGGFRFKPLQPGIFEVRADAPKLRTVVQKGVRVDLNAPADVYVMMEADTAQEEVKVIERAPNVNTSTAQVRERMDAEFVNDLPVEVRYEIQSMVSFNTPGVTPTSNRSARIRGGNTGQTRFSVDGFDTVTVSPNSLAAFEVQTAGYGAEHGNIAGGVINMVSKSGSNRHEIEFLGFHEDSNLRLFTDSGDLAQHSWNTFFNIGTSGPIIRDRLWYVVNLESRLERNAREKHPSGLLPDPPQRRYTSFRPELKLTWQVTPRNVLSWRTTILRSYIRNALSGDSTLAESQENREFLNWFSGVTWDSVLTDSTFFRSQLGFNINGGYYEPMRCLDDPDCLDAPRVRQTFPITYNLGNGERARRESSTLMEIINQIEHTRNTKSFGDHVIKLKSHLWSRHSHDGDLITGDSFQQYNGTTRDRERVYFSNDPRVENEERRGWRFIDISTRRHTLSLQDSMRIGRYVTVTPGVGMHHNSASTPAAQSVTLSGFTPHLAVAWDATHDGRTALRASFNQYVDPDVGKLASFLQSTQVSRECRWNETSQAFDRDCVYSGGAQSRTIGLPCGPTGLNADQTSCSEKLRLPRTWEYTAGAEREVSPGLVLSSDLVYRRYAHQYEDLETNRIWNDAGSALNESTGAFRNGRPVTIFDLGTPEIAQRRNVSVTTTIRKREGAFKAMASYTWARLWGRSDNNSDSELGTNRVLDAYFLDGYLPDDSRHQVKSAFTWQATRWLSSGLIFRYYSGRPYNRRYRNDVTGGFTDLRSRVGTSPEANINDPGDDRVLRMPDVQEVNLQLKANLQPLLGWNADVWADVLNVLGLRTTKSVIEQDGPTFGQSSSRMSPAQVRFGLRFRI